MGFLTPRKLTAAGPIWSNGAKLQAASLLVKVCSAKPPPKRFFAARIEQALLNPDQFPFWTKLLAEGFLRIMATAQPALIHCVRAPRK